MSFLELSEYQAKIFLVYATCLREISREAETLLRTEEPR
jgi:hypothetical protein